jgi:hypothetical protein
MDRVRRTYKSRDNSVGIDTGQGLDDRMIGVRFPVGMGIFLFDTTSRQTLRPTHPPTQRYGGLSLRVKWPGREADHSPSSSAEVKKMSGAITLLPPHVFMVWCLLKHRDNFTFAFYVAGMGDI